MRCISHDHAVTQATANARTFEEAFRVFTDTNGVWNCERDDKCLVGEHEVYYPNGTMERKRGA